MNTFTVTVTQLNRYAKSLLEGDVRLRDIFVQGELSGVSHSGAGHLYFTLRDDESAVRCILFSGRVGELSFAPQEGMQVIVRGTATIYERGGSYQLSVTDMAAAGVGAAYMAFQRTKEKLASEGLFDPGHKKALPALPRQIAVVTSEQGAAIEDIKNTLSMRYPLVKLMLFPSRVQGAGAAEELREAVAAADLLPGSDLIILARGGGSVEDLSAFNDEALARAVYACRLPVVCGVGHETDTTICDFVADVRAATPTQAALLAVPDMQELAERIGRCYAAAREAVEVRLQAAQGRVEAIRAEALLSRHKKRLDLHGQRLDILVQSVLGFTQRAIEDKRRRAEASAALIHAASPLAALARGYALVMEDGRPLTGIGDYTAGQTVEIYLRDGMAAARITQVKEGHFLGQKED